MKILVTVAASFMATSALASGPVVPPAPPPVTVVPAAHNWGGAYLAFGVTYGRAGMDTGVAIPTFPDASGAGLSAIAGYNWQNGNLVYGAEVALDFTRRSGTNDCGAGVPSVCQTRQENHASIRGRVGLAMDRTLFFVTAGLATDRRRVSGTFVSDSERHNGPMLGVGVEHALSNTWSVRGDLEHYFLSTETYGAFPTDADITLIRLSAVRRF